MERGLGRTRVAIRLNESITEAVPRKSKTRRCRAHRREGAAVGLDGSGAGWDGGAGLGIFAPCVAAFGGFMIRGG